MSRSHEAQATMQAGLVANRGAVSTAALLDEVRLYHRRSLDRAKFWNNCAQSRDLAAATRGFCRSQRQMESDHRRGLTQLRLELSRTSPLTPGSEELAQRLARVEAIRRASNSLTLTLTRFVLEWEPDPVPDWLKALRIRSGWLNSVTQMGTGPRAAENGAGEATPPG